MTLTSLDGIGEPVPSDSYWPPTIQDVLCAQAGGDDRFDVYRSHPIVCTTEAFTDGTPTGLPGSRTYLRLNRSLQVRPEDNQLCQAGPPAPRAELALETDPPIPSTNQYPAFNPVVNGRLNLVQGEKTGTIKITWGNALPAGTLLSLQQDPAAMEVLTEAGWVSTLTDLTADSYRDDAGDVVLCVRPVDVPGPQHALDSTMVLSSSLAGRPPSQAQLMVRAVAPGKRVKLVVLVIKHPPNVDPNMPPVLPNRQIQSILELTNKIYHQAGIQFELAPNDIRTFREDQLLDYVNTQANKNLILGHINQLPANQPGIQNLTIVITGTINGKAGGIAYPAEHFALIGMQIFDRNKRHMAHELAHLLGMDKPADDLQGVENRLRLMLHDENTLSDQTINIGNELRPDEVHRIRTTLPGGFVR